MRRNDDPQSPTEWLEFWNRVQMVSAGKSSEFCSLMEAIAFLGIQVSTLTEKLEDEKP